MNSVLVLSVCSSIYRMFAAICTCMLEVTGQRKTSRSLLYHPPSVPVLPETESLTETEISLADSKSQRSSYSGSLLHWGYGHAHGCARVCFLGYLIQTHVCICSKPSSFFPSFLLPCAISQDPTLFFLIKIESATWGLSTHMIWWILLPSVAGVPWVCRSL